MMSWNGNASCITGSLCGNPLVTCGFPSQRASNAELCCFPFCQHQQAVESTVWVATDMRCHEAHARWLMKDMVAVWTQRSWPKCYLTHLGRATHICVSELTIIGSDNGLSPDRRQAIICTNAGILLIRTLGTSFSEILSTIHTFSFKKMHLKMSSAKCRLFRLSLNELKHRSCKHGLHQ